MSFQRLSERVRGKSRPPESRWKVIQQSRTSGRETPITEFVMCSWHKQLPHVIGIGPQWATANVRQKTTVVCEVRGSQSDKRLMRLRLTWVAPEKGLLNGCVCVVRDYPGEPVPEMLNQSGFY